MNLQQILELAHQHHRAGRLDEAEAIYRQILAQSPDQPDTLRSLGLVEYQRANYEPSLKFFQRAITAKPAFPEARLDLGNVLRELGKLDPAIDAYRQAIALRPDFIECHIMLGLALLLKGDFTQGFREYEWRWKRHAMTPILNFFRAPRWDGSSLPNGTILLFFEQGFGDTLQFIRYAPLVAARCRRLIMYCQPELVRLLKSVPALAQLIEPTEKMPAHDVYCPMMSLPLALGATLESIPNSVPYVHADPDQVQQWRHRMQADRAKIKVGLAWAGKAAHAHDRNRSMTLSYFAPLAQVADASFYSLQKGRTGEQPPVLPAGMNFIDWTGELHDFGDTAALVANLDLVISVDTSIAHLAGAMGRPVWTLLPFMPDWRWLLNRTDSPWYPTMRLFRQSSRGDWNDVIRQVADGLSRQARMPTPT